MQTQVTITEIFLGITSKSLHTKFRKQIHYSKLYWTSDTVKKFCIEQKAELWALHLLSKNSFSFFSLMHMFSVSKEIPTKVSHHVRATFTTISAFHDGNVLVKSLTCLISHFTEVCRKERKMGMQEMDFKWHATTKTVKCMMEFFDKVRRIFIAMIAQKTLTHSFKSTPRSLFILFQSILKVRIFHQTANLWANENTFLQLGFTYARENLPQVRERRSSFIKGFHEIFHQSQLNMERRKKHIVWMHKWCVRNVFLTRNKRFTTRPWSLDVMLLRVSAVPQTQKTTVFREAALKSQQQSHNLQIRTDFPFEMIVSNQVQNILHWIVGFF